MTQNQHGSDSNELTSLSIIDELGVTPLINAGGPNTKHSVSRHRPISIEAMEAMSEVFVDIDEKDETRRYRDQMNFVFDQIAEIPGLSAEVKHNYDHYIPHAVVTFTEHWKGPSYSKIADRMKSGSPRIYTAVDYRPNPDRMWIDPLNLQDGEIEQVADQLRNIVIDAPSSS